MSQTIESGHRLIAPTLEVESANLSDAGIAAGLESASYATARTATRRASSGPLRRAGEESLFDRFAWLYVFFREKLFRDDTDRIINALWPDRSPAAGTRLIELGCGPGFYSCGLAARFPQLAVLGVDRAARQLDCAERKAQACGLPNCLFEPDNVLDLSYADESFDVTIAARLFTVLREQERAIAEMHRVLRPGGQCLIAEPRYVFWASLPLFAMWVLARLTGMKNGYCEPRRATVLSSKAFRNLFNSQPWRSVKVWQDGRYQYALCEKV
ncbi:MAG TPA: methyltransferase domain-containing protein [Chthoniobacterales bacterium]